MGVATGEAGPRRAATREVLRGEDMFEAADALDERLLVIGFAPSKKEAVKESCALLVCGEAAGENRRSAPARDRSA